MLLVVSVATNRDLLYKSLSRCQALLSAGNTRNCSITIIALRCCRACRTCHSPGLATFIPTPHSWLWLLRLHFRPVAPGTVTRAVPIDINNLTQDQLYAGGAILSESALAVCSMQQWQQTKDSWLDQRNSSRRNFRSSTDANERRNQQT